MSNESRAFLDELLCTVLAAGLVLVLLVPAARGMGAAGWWPLWLVGMPASAWWSLRGFPLPARRPATPVRAGSMRARRGEPQARRPARALRRGGQRAAA